MQSVLLRRVAAWVLAAAACALLAAAVGSAAIPASAGRASARAASASGGLIAAVGAENEYANVISQIGGRYVRVSAIESNPNTDPHSFEASPSVAQEVSAAAARRAERRRLRLLHEQHRGRLARTARAR